MLNSQVLSQFVERFSRYKILKNTPSLFNIVTQHSDSMLKYPVCILMSSQRYEYDVIISNFSFKTPPINNSCVRHCYELINFVYVLANLLYENTYAYSLAISKIYF